VVGIDGRNGAGKTTLSNWLGWQLNMPVVHLDLFMAPTEDGPPQWRIEPLRLAVERRLVMCKVALVEGVMLLDVLGQIAQRPDLLILVEPPPDGPTDDNPLFTRHLQPYLARTYGEARRPDLVVQAPADPR
jgi:adenylate kinase family enzyme